MKNGSSLSILNALLEYFGPFSTLVCDEGERLSGGELTPLSKLLNRVWAKQRIILTENPVQSSFEELMNLLRFVDPEYFIDVKVG